MPPSSHPMLSKSHVFDPRPRLQFQIAANRYWIGEPPDEVSRTRGDVITLVFVTGHAAHKEQWEPTIERLFQNQQAAPKWTVWIHDIWSIDLPNLGDSALLNEEVLRSGYGIFSWEYHARALHAFLAGLGSGVDVDFSKRRLVLIGHSIGGTASILTTTYYPVLKISSLHLIEPFITAESTQKLFSYISETSSKRRDTWPSREEAFHSSRVRSVMCTWDERVLRIFVEHGLQPLPTPERPDLKEGVTLKCTRQQEAATYRDYVSPVIAYRHLRHVVKEIPTHIILGEITDYLGHSLHDDMLYDASGGISNFASATRIPGAGHMVVQTHPDDLGDTIWKHLIQPCKISPKDTMVAKL